jgi:hypothetical protein
VLSGTAFGPNPLFLGDDFMLLSTVIEPSTFSLWEVIALTIISGCVLCGSCWAFGVMLCEIQEALLRKFNPPKPKKWNVGFQSPSGYPTRGYWMTEEQVNRVMTLIHHELDYPSSKANT